jgi:hypothetical protein
MNLREIPLFGFNRSGGCYVTNILLELGVCVYSLDFDSGWEVQPGGSYRLKPSYREYLGCFYPRFMEQDEFEFPAGVGIRFTHGPPAARELESRALHLVRDPRGVALSVYDRYSGGRTLEDFLGSSCHRDGPRPRPYSYFGLYPTECWALFSSALEAAYADGSESLLSLRFEQLKETPIQGMHAILEHLGLLATDAEVQRAVDRSSKEAIAEAEKAWRAMHPGVDSDGLMGVKRSKTGGWAELFGPAEMRALGAITHEVMGELGYGPYAAETSTAAVERGRPCEGPQEVLTQTALALNGRAGSAASRLELGLRVRACDHVQRIFGDQSDSEPARRALARMLQLYRLSEGRALHWLSAREGLQAIGDTEGARFALEVGVARSNTSGELMESALQLSLHGDPKAALDLVERAADIFGTEVIQAWGERAAKRASLVRHASPAAGLLARIGWAAAGRTHARVGA